MAHDGQQCRQSHESYNSTSNNKTDNNHSNAAIIIHCYDTSDEEGPSPNQSATTASTTTIQQQEGQQQQQQQQPFVHSRLSTAAAAATTTPTTTPTNTPTNTPAGSCKELAISIDDSSDEEDGDKIKSKPVFPRKDTPLKREAAAEASRNISSKPIKNSPRKHSPPPPPDSTWNNNKKNNKNQANYDPTSKSKPCPINRLSSSTSKMSIRQTPTTTAPKATAVAPTPTPTTTPAEDMDSSDDEIIIQQVRMERARTSAQTVIDLSRGEDNLDASSSCSSSSSTSGDEGENGTVRNNINKNHRHLETSRNSPFWSWPRSLLQENGTKEFHHLNEDDSSLNATLTSLQGKTLPTSNNKKLQPAELANGRSKLVATKTVTKKLRPQSSSPPPSTSLLSAAVSSNDTMNERTSILQQHDPDIFKKALASRRALDVRDWSYKRLTGGSSTNPDFNTSDSNARGIIDTSSIVRQLNFQQFGMDRNSNEPLVKSSLRQQDETFLPPSTTKTATIISGTTAVSQPLPARAKRKRNAKSKVASMEESPAKIAGDRTNEVDDIVQPLAAMNDELPSMTTIEHLTRTTIDPITRLPSLEISVFGAPDDVIYTFRLDVRKSSIPNSGLGAFLTFVSARELLDEKKRRGEWLLDSRPYKARRTMRELTAEHSLGFGMNVKLTGDNLHCPFNATHLLGKLHAVHPVSKRRMIVTLAPHEKLYYDDEIQGLTRKKDSERIGFLGLYEESDYLPAPGRTFSSLFPRCGMIDLGRYAPFKVEDRKKEFQFELKSFLFSHEPSEWAFGVDEDLQGHRQILDITDDLTGEPHELARTNIAMYINEVGHNRQNVQNVFALDMDDRSVKYFLRIDEPMMQGQEVEALVDYLDVYETIRERKGYGLMNLNGGIQSDNHLPTLLERNFVERRDVEDAILEMQPALLYITLEWIDNIRSQLADLTEKFIRLAATDGPINFAWAPIPTAKQFVALRRLDWLGRRFRTRFERIIEMGVDIFAFERIFYQTKNWIDTMKWHSCSAFMMIISSRPDLCDRDGVNYRDFFGREITEEVCYDMKDSIQRPLKESVWCCESIRLIISLCQEVARHFWELNCRRLDTLVGRFTDAGNLAASEIVRNLRYKEVSTKWEPMLEDDDFCAYYPGLNIETLDPTLSMDNGSGLTESSVNNNNNTNGAKKVGNASQKKVALREALAIVARNPTILDEYSYLQWQIVYIIDSFANKFIGPSKSVGDALCQKLGLDPTHVLAKGWKLGKKKKDKLLSAKPLRAKSLSKKSLSKKALSAKPLSKKSPRPEGKRVRAKSNVPHVTYNNALFWGVIWEQLTSKLEWQLAKGGRPNDFFFLPPGVKRARGFRNRVDYFDSTTQVMTVVRTDPRWKDRTEVKECVEMYNKCLELLNQLKKTKKLPKFPNKMDLVAYLKVKVNSS